MFILMTLNGTQASDVAQTTGTEYRLTGKKTKQTPPLPEQKAKIDGYDPNSSSELKVRQNGPATSLGSFQDDFRSSPILRDKQLRNLMSFISSGEGKDKISRYLDANEEEPGRFMIIGAGTEKGEKSEKHLTNFMNMFSHQFDEQSELFQNFIDNDKVGRELAKVYAALVFSVSNPIGAVSALGNLLSGLETAEAKKFAGDSLSSVASFAAEQAVKKAQYDPKSDEGSKLYSVLKGIEVRFCDCSGEVKGEGNDEQSIALPHPETESNAAPSGIPGENGARPDKLLVLDTQTGKIVDDVDVYYEGTELEENCAKECAATQAAISNVLTATDAAKDAVYEEKQEENTLVKGSEQQKEAKERITILTSEKSQLLSEKTVDRSKIVAIDNEISTLKPRIIYTA